MGKKFEINLFYINIVDDDKDRKDFVPRMGDLSSETDTAIYAWALLKNHAHILLRSGAVGLPKFMPRFLTGYGGILQGC